MGSLVVGFTREDGGSFTVTYLYYQPCGTQNVLPDVIVQSSVNGSGAGGGIPSLGFGSIIPRGIGNLFSGINWAPPSGGSTGGGGYTGGPYLEDPTVPFGAIHRYQIILDEPI